jgi:signal transduction histidine kinase
LGAYLITEVQNVRDSFERVRGFFVFLAFGVLAAPLLTSFVDASVVIFTSVGRGFWYVWTNRLLSNMLAELTVVPAIVVLYIGGTESLLRAGWPKYLEALSLGLVVVSAALYAFAPGLSETSRDYSFYILLLLLSWATLRFRFAGLSLTLLLVSLISSWVVVHGHASFLASPNNVLPLQVSLFMVALPSMFLAVALVQQQETANSLRASRAQLVNSQEQERSRIARELHDGVGQLLALLALELQQLQERSDVETKSKLENLRSQVAEISQTTHEISYALHPSHLEYVGLPVALKRLCTDFSKENVTTIDFDCNEANVPEHLNPGVSLSFYRVAQEALHNSVKYSKAQRIKVRLRAKSGRLWLEINDNGVGFATGDKASGMGLMNMRDRMESLGGTLSVKSTPTRGTQIYASIPLRDAA